MAKNGCTKQNNLFFESITLTHHSTSMGRTRSSKKRGAAQKEAADVNTAQTKGKKAGRGKPKPSPVTHFFPC
jgi:hypothetical protein